MIALSIDLSSHRIAASSKLRVSFRLSAALLSVCLAGCVPAIPVAPAAAPHTTGTSLWRVEPGDVIRLRTWQVSDQSGDLPVNERGQVLAPNAGRITVLGLPPDAVESTILRAYAGRVDSSRIEVTLLRPVSVVGGVKLPSVQLADPSSSVLSLISRSGGPIRPGGDWKVYLLRIGEPTHEVSTADRVSDLGIRSTDQLYVQDPPFFVRNAIPIQAAFEALEFISTSLTIFYLVRR